MKTRFILFLLAIFALASCKKGPGEGGDASISGRIMLEKRLVLNNPEIVLYTAPAADHNVFIIYGDGPGPDDQVETNYDGEFEFPYLREGEYEIYVYSKDTSTAAVNGQAPEDMVIRRSVTIGDRKEKVELPDILIYD